MFFIAQPPRFWFARKPSIICLHVFFLLVSVISSGNLGWVLSVSNYFNVFLMFLIFMGMCWYRWTLTFIWLEVWNNFYFPQQLGWWSNLTNSIIFQRGRLKHQPVIFIAAKQQKTPAFNNVSLGLDSHGAMIRHEAAIAVLQPWTCGFPSDGNSWRISGRSFFFDDHIPRRGNLMMRTNKDITHRIHVAGILMLT